MYYLQTRYYDPKICRFISPDDVFYLGANGDLVSYNLYAYCSNDPVNYVDPSGHSILAVLLIGIVVVMPLAFAVSTIISDLEDTGGEPEIFGKRVIDSESSDAYSPYFEYETLDVFGVRYGAAFEAGLYTQVSKENEYKGANFDVLKVDANITMFGGGAGVYILEHTWTQKNINIFGHEVKLSVSANVGAGAKLQLGKRSVIGLSFGPGFKFTADF